MECKLSGLKRFVVLLYFIAIAAACIYVPWKGDLQATRASLGYAPLWLPPTDAQFGNFVVVDFEKAVLEIAAITALGGVLFLLADTFEKYRPLAKLKRKSPPKE